MRLAIGLGLLLFLLPERGVVAGGIEIDPVLWTLMERANEKDVAGVIALESQTRATASQRYAYRLARYIADPEAYKDEFVQEFPASDGGPMGSVYPIEKTQVGEKRLTPYFLYSFDQLAVHAHAGHRVAATRLLQVAANSGGVVTEFVCERVSQLLSTAPRLALEALGQLEKSERPKVYACFGSASRDELTAVRSALESSDLKDDVLAKEILAAVRDAY